MRSVGSVSQTVLFAEGKEPSLYLPVFCSEGSGVKIVVRLVLPSG